MYLYFRRAFATLCISGATLGTLQMAFGEQQLRFAGSYQLTQIVEDGSQVHFTVKFTLLNPGDEDVKGGILVLMDSQPSSLLVGKVATIPTLPHLGQIGVTQTLSVSAAEYARWQKGHEPRFHFLVPDPAGAIDVPVQARPIAPPAQKTN